MSSEMITPDPRDQDAINDFRRILDRTQIQYRTVADLTYTVMREAIVTGAFPPGSRLRQDELAEVIGVSRMPVRSALLQLEADGLVDFHPHRGAVVRKLTVAQIREIYDLRSLLESYALRKAMRAMTGGRLERLEKLAARIEETEEGPDYLDARIGFYHELYAGSEQPLLIEFIDRLRNSVGRYMLGQRVSGSRTHGHSKLLDYLRQGNEEAAVAWLQMHFADVSEALIAQLENE